jgi:type I restriction enzyme M protein
MDQATHNKIISFIWGIADDVLRDLFKRGKYPDVILPMCVIRRLDAVLAGTKKEVLETKKLLDDAGITEQKAALCAAAKQAFYNTSPFQLADLKSRASRQALEADFRAYLDGFSDDVQDIIENFKFRNQIETLSKADALGTLIAKFLDPDINLGPNPTEKHPALDNHAMGTVFEELVRKFNEENNEEAGEHWTPRDAVKLMANLIFLPVADDIADGSYTLYDGALGTGGMLTVAEETLRELAKARGKSVGTHLYGQEINPETFAICKADMLLKGEGENAKNVIGGPEYSTLANDAFQTREFHFMLSNPPYGKSWKKDLEAKGGKQKFTDPRFNVTHNGEPLSLVTRSSDGQLLFLANMVSKMNHKAARGSRIAEVHNGSSLFTGDAGQGESNVRRYVIENDWLEAIVALPLNMFYNTGIATYIWVLTNRKPAHRKGKVQLIDATQWFKPLRKNLGKKNCELAPDDIQRVCDAFLKFEPSDQSKIFPNEAFGYRKIVVERPLRWHSQLTPANVEKLRFASGDAEMRATLFARFGDALFDSFESVRDELDKALAEWGREDAPEEDAEDEDDSDAGDEPAPAGLPAKLRNKLLIGKFWARDGRLFDTASQLRDEVGGDLFTDHNVFRERCEAALKKLKIKLSAAEFALIMRAVSWRDESAPPVIAKEHKPNKAKANPLHGLFAVTVNGKPAVVEYEPDPDLRDTEQVPLQEDVEEFLRREVLPYAPGAWYDDSQTKIGYEISFTRHFYKPEPLRSLDAIRADILALEKETEGLLSEIVKGGGE